MEAVELSRLWLLPEMDRCERCRFLSYQREKGASEFVIWHVKIADVWTLVSIQSSIASAITATGCADCMRRPH